MAENEKVVAEKQPVEKEEKAAKTERPNRPSRRPASKDGKAGGGRPQKGDRRGAPRGRGGRNEREFNEKVIFINRISKTVKGGRKMRFSALVAVGDGHGYIGFASGKANEVPDAIKKALDGAKKNMFKVYVSKGDTIPHEVYGKFGACKVFLKPAPEGTGVISGGPVRAIMELAGIKNIYSKVYGSRAAINIVRATCNGLKSLKTPSHIAQLRGKKIEDIKA